MTAWVLSIASVAVVSVVSLAGLMALSSDERLIRRRASVLVSFAVGALLGDSFIHLIPETFAAGRGAVGASLLVLAGMLLFFVVEKLLRHRHGPLHHHGPETARPALAFINLVGDAIHNFIDGVLIGASYLVSPTLGISTTLAVLLHEIPQELGDFAVLIHSGLDVRRAVLFNLLSASVAVLGAVVALVMGSVIGPIVSSVLVPVTAGGFVYIAAADLIPELQQDRSVAALAVQASLIAAGIGVMALLATLP